MLRSAVVCGVFLSLTVGCTTSRPAGDPLADLDVEDPDPDQDTDLPKFCNPTGKQGDDLKKCYEQNESLYKEFDDEAKKREPWFNFTPDSWASSEEIDSKHVLKVVKEPEAVAKLEGAPIVELTPTEVEFFAGKQTTFPGLKPFLVRGLLYFRDTGAFAVYTKEEAILVHHDSHGATTPNETRSAVVVFLTQKPKDVFVDCGVGE